MCSTWQSTVAAGRAGKAAVRRQRQCGGSGVTAGQAVARHRLLHRATHLLFFTSLNSTTVSEWPGSSSSSHRCACSTMPLAAALLLPCFRNRGEAI